MNLSERSEDKELYCKVYEAIYNNKKNIFQENLYKNMLVKYIKMYKN